MTTRRYMHHTSRDPQADDKKERSNQQTNHRGVVQRQRSFRVLHLVPCLVSRDQRKGISLSLQCVFASKDVRKTRSAQWSTHTTKHPNALTTPYNSRNTRTARSISKPLTRQQLVRWRILCNSQMQHYRRALPSSDNRLLARCTHRRVFDRTASGSFELGQTPATRSEFGNVSARSTDGQEQRPK